MVQTGANKPLNASKVLLQQLVPLLSLSPACLDALANVLVIEKISLGKTAGKDAQAKKSTYVTLLGLNKAKALAYELHANALTALAPFGQEADPLRHLAHFITQRRF